MQGRSRRLVLGWGAVAVVMVSAVAGLLLVADDAGVDAVTPRGTALIGPVVALDDVLFGRKSNGYPKPAGLLRSRDGGRTWADVALPQQPPNATVVTVGRLGDIVYAAAVNETAAPMGARATNDRFVWISDDGERWRGPLVMERTGDTWAPGVGLASDMLVTGSTMGGQLVVFTSIDEGRSWDRRPVSNLPLAPDEVAHIDEVWGERDGTLRAIVSFSGVVDADHDQRDELLSSADAGRSWQPAQLCESPRQSVGPCRAPTSGDGLVVRGLEASLDGGVTWKRATFAGPFDRALAFTSVKALPTGGWLGTVEGNVFAGGGPLAWVVRSDDGLHWTPLLGAGADQCPPEPADTDSPANLVSTPARFDGRWFVVFSCSTRGVGLYASDDARAFRLVRKMGGDPRTAPFVWQGKLVVPVFTEESRLAQLLVIRP